MAASESVRNCKKCVNCRLNSSLALVDLQLCPPLISLKLLTKISSHSSREGFRYQSYQRVSHFPLFVGVVRSRFFWPVASAVSRSSRVIGGGGSEDYRGETCRAVVFLRRNIIFIFRSLNDRRKGWRF